MKYFLLTISGGRFLLGRIIVIGKIETMRFKYNKPVLEKILEELTKFSCPKESHTWERFEIYNGKPEPDAYKRSAREDFLKQIHSMNGNISKIALYTTRGMCLSIGIEQPVMQIDYKGNGISYGFRLLLEKYKIAPSKRIQRKRSNTQPTVIMPKPQYAMQ